jgi:hypothetical protein
MVALTQSSMRFAYPISPSAALTDVSVMLVFLICVGDPRKGVDP